MKSALHHLSALLLLTVGCGGKAENDESSPSDSQEEAGSSADILGSFISDDGATYEVVSGVAYEEEDILGNQLLVVALTPWSVSCDGPGADANPNSAWRAVQIDFFSNDLADEPEGRLIGKDIFSDGSSQGDIGWFDVEVTEALEWTDDTVSGAVALSIDGADRGQVDFKVPFCGFVDQWTPFWYPGE